MEFEDKFDDDSENDKTKIDLDIPKEELIEWIDKGLIEVTEAELTDEGREAVIRGLAIENMKNG